MAVADQHQVAGSRLPNRLLAYPPASGQTQALQRVLQPRQTFRPSRRFTHRAQHLHAQYTCLAFHAAMALYYALDPLSRRADRAGNRAA
ncbi:MAG: hypothetical protein M3Z57_09375 [Candidatus Dormibacteraeota bacterium]|nr:hypothetical protein [Candidatus Dormibacteraeota bacterium]